MWSQSHPAGARQYENPNLGSWFLTIPLPIIMASIMKKVVPFENNAILKCKVFPFSLPWWHWHIGLFCLFTVLVSGVTSILLNKRHQIQRYPYCMIHVQNIQKMGKTDSRVLAFRIVTSLGKKQAEVSGLGGGTQVGSWQCSTSWWWLHGSIYFEIKSWYYTLMIFCHLLYELDFTEKTFKRRKKTVNHYITC